MIRILVADASSADRERIATALRTDPELAVVGEARDGPEAIALVRRLRPDVVVMNVALPRANGLEATKAIMVEQPTPIVILSDQRDKGEIERSMHALHAGALAVSPKPNSPEGFAERGAAHDLVATVKAMSQVKLVRRWRKRPGELPARRDPSKPQIVAVAASTGGPAALQRVLSDLPNNFPLPIVVVQHIANGFIDGLVEWLDTTVALQVRLARHGELLAGRTLYVAPDDCHLGVTRDGRMSLVATAPIGGFRPSADYLLHSVAQSFGREAIAVMLTGMGHDGVDGLRSVRSAGGTVLVQDQATSAVFGMPGAAIDAGLADAVLPLPKIASRLVALVQ